MNIIIINYNKPTITKFKGMSNYDIAMRFFGISNALEFYRKFPDEALVVCGEWIGGTCSTW